MKMNRSLRGFFFFFLHQVIRERKKKKIDYTCIRDNWKFRIIDREPCYILRFNYTIKLCNCIIIFVAITRSDV